ncbi:hypothetical protein OOK13_29040 [Streptomyces sp. NBC_00378]|uniref:hypothetical protein n=1 Tax=unclassified Streptomyces TaxID=2593676 RepID=UPI002250F677|nr:MULTISPECIES: hypothetical protein [unclassified Streptomyces]MCX5112455.1 hypothetical protein [Streptomyces sp. NBC_00378]
MAKSPEENSDVEEGPKGSRGTGSGRPSGTPDERSVTSVRPQSTQEPASPGFRSGGG